MEGKNGLRFESLAIHGGQRPDPASGAIIPPIHQTSTFVQDGVGEHKGYDYSRAGNPTRTALEANLAALEGARFALSFGSGCAATTTLLHLFETGTHIIASDDLYGGTWRLFTQVFEQLGFEFSFVDLSTPEDLDSFFKPTTKMVWLETPTNPLLKISSIREVASRAHRHNALLVVDNTFMSPYFQRPLTLGADIVVHSVTKYLNGHSDVVGGAIMTSDEGIRERLAFLQKSMGAVSGPMDAWLTLRGIKTLPVRMERHGANAMRIARWLEGHERVARVLYPGLASHPQHALAREQMLGYGGMISFVLQTDLDGARRFVESTRLFQLAESLGGVESLIELPAAMTHASMPPETRAAAGLDDGLVRLSVGIEHVDDLIADLEGAFDALDAA